MAIDAMRDLDRLHPLNQTAMHWRCIQLLDATYEVVRELLPDWQTVDQRQAWEDWATSEDRSQSKQVLVRIGAWHPCPIHPRIGERLPMRWLFSWRIGAGLIESFFSSRSPSLWRPTWHMPIAKVGSILHASQFKEACQSN
jgi:hypothetical protein